MAKPEDIAELRNALKEARGEFSHTRYRWEQSHLSKGEGSIILPPKALYLRVQMPEKMIPEYMTAVEVGRIFKTANLRKATRGPIPFPSWNRATFVRVKAVEQYGYHTVLITFEHHPARTPR